MSLHVAFGVGCDGVCMYICIYLLLGHVDSILLFIPLLKSVF